MGERGAIELAFQFGPQQARFWSRSQSLLCHRQCLWLFCLDTGFWLELLEDTWHSMWLVSGCLNKVVLSSPWVENLVWSNLTGCKEAVVRSVKGTRCNLLYLMFRCLTTGTRQAHECQKKSAEVCQTNLSSLSHTSQIPAHPADIAGVFLPFRIASSWSPNCYDRVRGSQPLLKQGWDMEEVAFSGGSVHASAEGSSFSVLELDIQWLAGVSGPDNDRTIFPTSLCGPKISGPENNQIVWSLCGPEILGLDNDQIVCGRSLVLVVVWSCYTGMTTWCASRAGSCFSRTLVFSRFASVRSTEMPK